MSIPKRPENITDEGYEIMHAWEVADDAYAQTIENSERGMNYLNNNPYTDEEKADAKTYKKPLLRYNITQPLFATLQGNEQQFRRRARARSHGGGEQAAIMNIVQGRWNAINDEQDIEEQLETMLVDALALEIGGAIERRFEVNEMGYLDFTYEMKNSMRIRYDPDTLNSDYRLQKCNWILKEEWLTLDALIDRYGDRADFSEEKKIAWKDKFTDFFKRFTDKGYSNQTHYNKESGKYRVVEMQKRVFRKVVTFYDGEKVQSLPADEYRKIYKNDGVQKIMEGTQKKIHIAVAAPFFNWTIVQDEDAKWPSSNFDVFPMWSYGYNTQVIEGTSLMGMLEDVQDDVNKGVSQNRDYVTQHISGPLATSTRETEANEQLDRKGNQPGQRIGLKDLKNNMPKRIAPEQLDPMSLGSTDHAEAYGHKISSVSEQVQGGGGKSGESNALFESKLAQAAASINPYFKNASKTRKALMMDFIDNFGWVYSEQDRVLELKSGPGKDGVYSQEIVNLSIAGQVLNDVSNPSMYVEIDEGEDNTLQKEENFNQLLALANVVATINPDYVPVQQLIKAAPIEGTDEWLGWIEMKMKQQMQNEASAQALAEEQQTVAIAQGQKQLEAPSGA